MASKRVAKGVRRIGQSRYEFRAMVNGTSFSTTVRADSDAEARKLHRKWRVEVDEGSQSPVSGTMADLLDRWLDHKRMQRRSESTTENYESHVRLYLKPRLGKVKVAKITTLMLDDFYSALRESGREWLSMKRATLSLGS